MVQKTHKIGMIVYNLARELLVKDKGGIATLPQNKEILTKVQDIFDMLKAGGYNPISAERDIKNTKDLKRVLTDVEMKLTIEKDLRKKSSEGIEQVLDKMDKGVPLNPSDQAKIEGGTPDKVLDAFKGFTPRVIQGGKLEGIEKLLKSGDVKKGVAPKTTKETIERKSMIDPKLTQEENIKNIMAENKAAAKRLEQKMNKEKDLGDKLKDLPDDIDPDAMAEGGLMRVGMFAGGPPFRRLLQFLNQQTGMTGSEALKKLKMTDQIKFFAKKKGFDPDKIRIEYIEQVLDALKADRKLIKGLEPDAPSAVTGKAKDEMELIADKMFTESFLDDTQKGRFKGMTSKDYDKSILEVETILKNLKPEGRKPNAEGGLMRLGFEKGGMSRRSFLKLMGGLASIPILGKLFKPAAKVAKVVQLRNTTTEMPAWFPEFIDKVTYSGVGKKIDADIMQYEVKELPGIKVYKHGDGKVFVEGQNDYYKNYEIEYEPPGYELVDEKTGKAVKTKGDFMAQEEVPVNVDPDGNADFDAEVLESVDDILSSDARAMEEYATGKKLKEMKRGEYNVGQAEARAEQAAEEAAELSDEFSQGGLAYMLGE